MSDHVGHIDKIMTEIPLPHGQVTPGGPDRPAAEGYPNFTRTCRGSVECLVEGQEHTIVSRTANRTRFLRQDCNDVLGRASCQGAQTIAAIRHLASSKENERKIFTGTQEDVRL